MKHNEYPPLDDGIKAILDDDSKTGLVATAPIKPEDRYKYKSSSGDTYKEIRMFKFPKMIARVYIPDLTPEERARRMKILHDAAARLLRGK